jgi:hypothetical protein
MVGNANQICHRLAETHLVGQMLILSAETLPPQYFYVHIWATHEWRLPPANRRGGTLSACGLREVQTVTVGDLKVFPHPSQFPNGLVEHDDYLTSGNFLLICRSLGPLE